MKSLLSAVVLTVCLLGCSSDDDFDADDLIGTWAFSDQVTPHVWDTIAFNSDNIATAYHVYYTDKAQDVTHETRTFKYGIVGDTIVLHDKYQTFPCKFSASKNKRKLSITPIEWFFLLDGDVPYNPDLTWEYKRIEK